MSNTSLSVSDLYLKSLGDLPPLSFFTPSYSQILSQLRKHRPFSTPFLHPVRKKDAPGYYEIISDPIDLSTMQKKADAYFYTTDSFIDDLRLMNDNCKRYNQTGVIVEWGEEMLRKGLELMANEEKTEKVDHQREKMAVDEPFRETKIVLNYKPIPKKSDDFEEYLDVVFSDDGTEEKQVEKKDKGVGNTLTQDTRRFFPLTIKKLKMKYIASKLREIGFNTSKKECLDVLEQVLNFKVAKWLKGE